MIEDLEQCTCPSCGEEFFRGFKSESGAYVVVCISCNETVMCYYEMGSANDG